jgi:hypothetical protein
MENGSVGWAQTYRIQNWRELSLWTRDCFLTPILNSVRPSRLDSEFGTSEPVLIRGLPLFSIR